MDREELKKIRNWPFSGGTQGEWAARSMGNAIIDALLSDPAPAQAAGDGVGKPRTLPSPKRIWSFDDRAAQQDSCDEWLATLPAPTYDLKMAYWQGWYEAFLVYDRTNGRPPPTLSPATPSTIDAALAAPASPVPAAQRIAEIAARLKAATPVETAEHPYRPHTALSERTALANQIKSLGRGSMVETLRIYAIHNPPQGSFAGSLWALSEQVDALITEADTGRADIAHLLSEVARLEAERDSWEAQFHSAASAASAYVDFWERHSDDFDVAGNYIPNSQMDGDIREAKSTIARLSAEAAAVRAGALEEAAKVATDIRASLTRGTKHHRIAGIIAAAIRALAAPSSAGGQNG